MHWLEKVELLAAQRKERQATEDKLTKLSGLYAFNTQYKTPHNAIKHDAHIHIEEPYYGGQFERIGQVLDIIDIGYLIANVASDSLHLDFFYAYNGKVFCSLEGYLPLDQKTLQEHTNLE